MEREATLPQLWKEASRLYRLAEKENGRYKEAQDLYSKVAILVSSLRLTSNNEELEDFGTKTLRYIALPYLLAQCIYNLNCPPVERVVRLKQTESYLNLYLEKCEKYKIMNPTDQKHYKKSTNLLKPEEKRALLKDQLQRTKDIEVAIATLEKKRQSRTTSQNEDQDDDDLSFSDEEDEREYILNLLGLYALRSISDLRSIESELPLAEEMAKRMANPTSNGASSTQDPRSAPNPNAAPYKPTVITSEMVNRFVAESRTKEQIKADVFKPSWIQPTYTIEQAGEIEMAIAAKRMQGTNNGNGKKKPHKHGKGQECDSEEESSEEEETDESVRKAREWDEFKDDNPTGSGNTYNRGI